MTNPCCSNHFGKLQIVSALAGTLLTGSALTAVFTPSIYALTGLVLPIVLGVGALIAWVLCMSLTVARCRYSPAKSKPPQPIINKPEIKLPKEPTPEQKQLRQACSNVKIDFLAKIKDWLQQSDYKSLKFSADVVAEMANEFASDVTETSLLLEIQSNFEKEIDELLSIAQGLRQGRKAEPDFNAHYTYMQIRTLYHSLRQREVTAEDCTRFSYLLNELGNINQPLEMGNTPLLLLAKVGKPLEFLPILAKNKADFNYQQPGESEGNTALIWAIANANNEIAQAIMQYPQNLDIQDDYKGNTAMILAVAKGYTNRSSTGQVLAVSNLQLVKTLLAKGANPNIKTKNGYSALQIAVLRRDLEMIKVLLQKGAVLDFDWKAHLNMTYEQVCRVLYEQAHVFLLDKETFEFAKKQVFELLNSTLRS